MSTMSEIAHWYLDYANMISPIPQSDSIQLDWTVTRCNRLLRSILSRIVTLQRLKDETLRTSTSQTIFGKPNVINDSFQNSKPRLRPTFGDTVENKENDPDWISGPTKKKKGPRHYSARPTQNTNHVLQPKRLSPALQPGALSIPTPYVSKVTRHDRPVPASGNSATSNLDMGPPRPRTVGRPKIDQEIKKGIMGERVSKTEGEYLCLQNLVKSFLELIDATNPQTLVSKKSIGGGISPTTEPIPFRGARSLLSICCRKVPTFIACVDTDQSLEDEEHRRDISAEVYSLLQETLESKEGRGWRHLREVVRAHGVQIIGNAIKEGLLPRDTTRTIIRHLLKPMRHQTTTASPVEAEILLTALIASEKPTQRSGCCPRNQFYANSVNNAAYFTDNVDTYSRQAFEFRQFKTLLASSYVPVEWMATQRVVAIWGQVFKAFIDSPTEAGDAFKLLESTVALGTGIQPTTQKVKQVLQEIPARYAQQSEGCPRCPRAAGGTYLARSAGQQHVTSSNQAVAKGQLSTAFTNTIFSISTILSAFLVATQLDQSECQHFDTQAILWALNSLSIDIISHHRKNNAPNALSLLHNKSQLAARRSAFILASTLVTKIAGCQLSSGYSGVDINDLVHCIEELEAATGLNQENDAGTFDSLPELVCSIAKGASQISKVDGFTGIQYLVRALNVPHCAGVKLTSSTRGYLRRLALSSALESSNQHNALEHLSLVKEIERNMSRPELNDTNKTPARYSTTTGETRRGFRWEEGICEWVTATPKLVRETKPVVLFALPQAQPTTPSGPNTQWFTGCPDTTPQAIGGFGEDKLNLSDLLLASSSPMEQSASIPRSLELNRPNRKRTHNNDGVLENAVKRRRDRAACVQEDTVDSLVPDLSESSLSLDSFSSSSSLVGDAIAKNPCLMKRKLLKRTVSEPIEDSSDDELVSPKHTRKRVATTSNTRNRGIRRVKRGMLLQSTSVIKTIPINKSRPVSGNEEGDEDELSFA
jgi:hypothetical protein